jgi:hypothetical protein
MNDDGFSRRDFLRGAAGAALVSAGVSCTKETVATPAGPKEEPAAQRATVVLIRHPEVVDEARKANGPVLASMLDQAVTRLVGVAQPEKAWASLFGADDTVGIKSNVWRFLRTPRELERAIEARLQTAGVAAAKISTDDRGVRDNPVFNGATALINVRPLRTHHWAGVGSLIKNYIMFSDSPPAWHADSCANLAGLWDDPAIKGKTRLNILVMLTPLFHSKGPHDYDAGYTWHYNGLLVGRDPVAVDATGVRILEAKRKEHFAKDLPFTVSPKHIRVAQDKFGLGIADPERIDVVKLGWQEGALI